MNVGHGQQVSLHALMLYMNFQAAKPFTVVHNEILKVLTVEGNYASRVNQFQKLKTALVKKHICITDSQVLERC